MVLRFCIILGLVGCGASVPVAVPKKVAPRPSLKNAIARCAIATARGVGRSEKRVYALTVTGETLARHNAAKGAFVALEAAYREAMDLDEIIPRQEALGRLGSAFANAGNVHRALAVARQVPAAHLRATALVDIARQWMVHHQTEGATNALHEALEQCALIEQPAQRAKALLRIADLYRKGGSPKGESHALGRFFALVKEVPSLSAAPETALVPPRLAALGRRGDAEIMAQLLRNPVLKEKALDQVYLSVSKSDSKVINSIVSRALRARAYIGLGKPAMAQKSAEAVFDDAERAGSLVRVAAAYDALGEGEKTQQLLAAARGTVSADASPFKKATVLSAFSRTAIAVGKMSWAEQPLHHALQAAINVSNAADRVGVLLSIASIYNAGKGPQGAALAQGVAIDTLTTIREPLRRAHLCRQIINSCMRTKVVRTGDVQLLWHTVKVLDQGLIRRFVELAVALKQLDVAMAAVRKLQAPEDRAVALARLAAQGPRASSRLEPLCRGQVD